MRGGVDAVPCAMVAENIYVGVMHEAKPANRI